MRALRPFGSRFMGSRRGPDSQTGPASSPDPSPLPERAGEGAEASSLPKPWTLRRDQSGEAKLCRLPGAASSASPCRRYGHRKPPTRG